MRSKFDCEMQVFMKRYKIDEIEYNRVTSINDIQQTNHGECGSSIEESTFARIRGRISRREK